jgi:hypothetical protein
MNKWVKVKNRLPKISGYYFCNLEKDGVQIYYYDKDLKFFQDEYTAEVTEEITHWSAIQYPESPK